MYSVLLSLSTLKAALCFFIRKTNFPLTSDSREIPRHQTGYIVGDLVHVDLRTRAYNARPMSSKAISHFVA